MSSAIYTASYSGTPVFEMMVNGVAVMRRRNDSSLNATQILKVAGIDKSKRSKILEREILIGTHEKVQGGYGKYQGTWVPYERALDLCKQYFVYDLLLPLLEFDSTNPATVKAPTKDQAIAARRKRAIKYQPLHLTPPSTSSVISLTKPLQVDGSPATPLSYNASMAMSFLGRPQYDSFSPGEEAAIARQALAMPITPEPPQKKQKTNAQESLISDDAFEIIEEFLPSSYTPLDPLDAFSTPNYENSQILVTQIFLNTEATTLADIFEAEDRLALVDIDVPIDDLQHTALHWAASLARISLVKELIHYGANILRANHAGESGLVRAVLVTNNSDMASFPQLLDIFYPAITLIDKAGRSVLHHIALTAGIKGRDEASRYYLACLFEWIVKRGSKDPSSYLSLGRFLGEIINAQDSNGDTALNIAARVGNRIIAQQFLEMGADSEISNRAGLRPIDFGIRGIFFSVKNLDVQYAMSNNTSIAARIAAGAEKLAHSSANDQCKDTRAEIVQVVKSLISESEAAFDSEYNASNERLEKMHEDLRVANDVLAGNRARLEKLKRTSDSVSRDKLRADNLERAIEIEDRSFREEEVRQGRQAGEIDYNCDFNPDEPFLLRSLQKLYDRTSSKNPNISSADMQAILALELKKKPRLYEELPSKSILRARIKAYRINETKLLSFANDLRSRSAELEQKFRRIVAQCASIGENEVDFLLEGLVQAVQSDPNDVDLSRVVGFLRKVEEENGS